MAARDSGRRELPPFLTRKQAAAFLGCSEDTIDRRIGNGKLKALGDERLVRISRDDLLDYVRRNKKWHR